MQCFGFVAEVSIVVIFTDKYRKQQTHRDMILAIPNLDIILPNLIVISQTMCDSLIFPVNNLPYYLYK